MNNNNLTQKEIIEKHLLSGDSINCGQAVQLYNIHVLVQRVAELRDIGYVIEDKNERPKCSNYYIPIEKKYAIYNRCNKQMLKRVDLNNQVFVWTYWIGEALPLRAKLFDICRHLQKTEKYKIEVIEV